jgi:hypothetical protein
VKDSAIPTHTCGGQAVKTFTTLRTVGVGTAGEDYARTESMEARWNKDMPAFKRLCKEGYSPQRIDGCHELEATAVSKWHIQTGQPHPDHKVWEGIEAAKQIARDNNLPVGPLAEM